jgi:hypothetical protein
MAYVSGVVSGFPSSIPPPPVGLTSGYATGYSAGGVVQTSGIGIGGAQSLAPGTTVTTRKSRIVTSGGSVAPVVGAVTAPVGYSRYASPAAVSVAPAAHVTQTVSVAPTTFAATPTTLVGSTVSGGAAMRASMIGGANTTTIRASRAVNANDTVVPTGPPQLVSSVFTPIPTPPPVKVEVPVPVPQPPRTVYIEKEVPVYIDKPVEKIVEKQVPVQVVEYVDRFIDRPVPAPAPPPVQIPTPMPPPPPQPTPGLCDWFGNCLNRCNSCCPRICGLPWWLPLLLALLALGGLITALMFGLRGLAGGEVKKLTEV